MRHILDEDPARSRLKRAIENSDRTQAKMAGETMHDGSIFRRHRFVRRIRTGRPHIDYIAGAREFDCNQPRIVTHTAGLRRIFTSDQVPRSQSDGLTSNVESCDAFCEAAGSHFRC